MAQPRRQCYRNPSWSLITAPTVPPTTWTAATICNSTVRPPAAAVQRRSSARKGVEQRHAPESDADIMTVRDDTTAAALPTAPARTALPTSGTPSIDDRRAGAGPGVPGAHVQGDTRTVGYWRCSVCATANNAGTCTGCSKARDGTPNSTTAQRAASPPRVAGNTQPRRRWTPSRGWVDSALFGTAGEAVAYADTLAQKIAPHLGRAFLKLQPGEVPAWSALFPDTPPHIRSLSELKLFRRRSLGRRFQDVDADARALRPLSTDPEALMKHYDLRAGTTKVKCGLNADAFKAGHQLHCVRCKGGLAADCYIHVLSAVISNGYLPAGTKRPDDECHTPWLPDDKAAAEWGDALEAELRRDLADGTVLDMGTNPARASARFVVSKLVMRSADVARKVYLGELDPVSDHDVIWRLKMRPVTDLSGSGVNAHAAKFRLRMESFDAALSLCTRGGYIHTHDLKRGE